MTATITAKDQFGNPIAGQAVTLAYTGGADTGTLPTTCGANTNASGVATCTISPQVTATRTITATIAATAVTATQSLTVNPSSTPSASLSTFTLSSNSVNAGSSVTATVTAKDQYSNVISGLAVTLGYTGGADTGTIPSSCGTTNGSGVTTCTISPQLAMTRTITATVTATAITATQSLVVSGLTTPSATNSTFTLSANTVTAGGSVTATVTAKDQYTNVISGLGVTLAYTGGADTGTLPTTCGTTTNGSGVLTCTISPQVVATRTITATVTATAITATQSLTVNASTTPSATNSTFTLSSNTATAGGSVTATVTAKDQYTNVIPGLAVTLAYTGGADTGTLPTTCGSNTNASGVSTCTISPQLATARTITATVTATAITATQSLTVSPATSAKIVFTAPTSNLTPQAGASFATPPAVQIRDTYNNTITSSGDALWGSNVTLQAYSDSACTTTLVGGSYFSTDASHNGASPSASLVQAATGATATYSANIQYISAQTIYLKATDGAYTACSGQAGGAPGGTFSVAVSNNATISPTVSTFTLSSNSVNAGSSVTATVTAKDQFGNPISGKAVTLAYTGGADTGTLPTTCGANTNASGVSTCTISPQLAMSRTITATIAATAVTATQSLTVSGLSTPSATNSTFTLSSNSVNAGSSVTATVTAKDQYTNVISGLAVTLGYTGGADTGTLPSSCGTTNGSGVITCTISPQLAMSRTITATVTATAITATQSLVVSGLTTPSATNSTFTLSANTVSAGGSVTATVTAKDQYTNVISGLGVTLGYTGGADTGTLPTTCGTTTNASGVVTCTISPQVVATRTITATVTATAITATQSLTVNASTTPSATLSTFSLSSNTVNAGSSVTATVTAKDQYSNVISGLTVTLGYTGGADTGTLPSTCGTTNGSGVITCTISPQLAMTRTITATVTATAITATQSLAVSGLTTPSATNSTFTLSANTVTAGGSVTATVTAKDQYTNVISGLGVTLAYTGGADTGTLPTTCGTTTNGSGVLTCTISPQVATTRTITATVTATAITATQSLTVNASSTPSATNSTFTLSSNSVNAGSSVTATVTAKDQYSNVISGLAVSLGYTGGADTGTLPTTCGSNTNGSGVSTCTISPQLAMTRTITATVTATAITATQSLVVSGLTTPSATNSTFTLSSASVNAGSSVTATVTAKDQYTNVISGLAVTLAYTGGADTGTLPTTCGSNTNGSGVSTCTISPQLAMTRTITATVTATAITATKSLTVNALSTPSATNSTFTLSSNSVNAGSSVTATVTAKDQYTNVISGLGVTLAYTGGADTGTLPTTCGATTNGSGVVTCTITPQVAMTRTITATVTATAITATQSLAVSGLTSPSATNSTFTLSSATVNAGSSVTATVTAKDQYSNVISGLGVTLAYTGGADTGTLPSSCGTTTDASGVVTCTISPQLAMTRTITATVTATAITATKSLTVSGLTTPSATNSTFTLSSNSVNAGSSVTATVTAKDQYTNVISGLSVTLGYTGGADTGTLPSSCGTTTNGSGVVTCTITPQVAMTRTITATVTATSITATQSLVVSGLATPSATNSTLTLSSNSVTAGGSVTATVTAKDQYSNVISGLAVTLGYTGGADTGTLPTTCGSNTNGSGISTCTISPQLAISRTITATIASTAVTATQSLATSAASKSQLVFTTQPGGGTAATAWTTQPVVEIRDPYGNKTADTDSIVLTLTTGTGALSGSASVPAVAGVATFSGLSINLTGSDKVLTATDGGITKTSNAFTINPGALNDFLVSAATGTPNAGVNLDVTVTARDAQGNTKTDLTGNVVLSSSDAGIVFVSPASNTVNFTGLSGVKVWTVQMQNGGSRSITATGSTKTGTTNVTVGAGSADTIAISTGNSQSATVHTTVAIAPRVVVKDAYNNVKSAVAVTWAIQAGGGSVDSTGGTSTDGSGLAQVTSWQVGDTVGANTLRATCASCVTTGFVDFAATGTVGAEYAVSISAGDGQSKTAGQNVTIAPAAIVKDQYNNVVSGVGLSWTVQTGGGSVVSTGGTTTNGSGIGTITSWTLGTTAGSNTLRATCSTCSTTKTVDFTATGTAGSAYNVAVSAGSGLSATAGSAVGTAPKVLVTDSNGNAVAGATISWAVQTGGGSVNSTGGTTTDASGFAQVTSWTLGTTVGSNTLRATCAGCSNTTTANFSATGTVGAAYNVAINAGDSQSAVVATNVASAPKIKVTDSNGNAVSGVTISWAAQASSGSVNSTGGTTTDASGFAQVTSWTLDAAAGTNTLRATCASCTHTGSVDFTATSYATLVASGDSTLLGGATATVSWTGGKAPYTLSIPGGTAHSGSPSLSSYSTSSSSVTYTAGDDYAGGCAGGGTDVVTVTDALGQSQNVTMTVQHVHLVFNPSTTVSYGSVTADTDNTAIPNAITVTNLGCTTTAGLNAASLSGADALQYQIASDACQGATLATNDTCDIVVTFKANGLGVGTYNAIVNTSMPGTGTGLNAARNLTGDHP